MDPSKLIDNQIAQLTDWRGKTMAKLRKIIHDAEPEITEEWKWHTAVFTYKGLVLAVGAFKGSVKNEFFPTRKSSRSARALQCRARCQKDTGN